MTDTNNRIFQLRKHLSKTKTDALLVSNPSNIFYITGFHGADSQCLITKNNQYILTDFRYSEEAAKTCKNFDILDSYETLLSKLTKLIKKSKFTKIGFEENYVSYNQIKTLEAKIGRLLTPSLSVIEKMRVIKDESELALIIKAAEINLNSISKIIKNIRINQSEKLTAASLEYAFIKNGADAMAFPSIVASGENSSKPHAKPTDKKFRKSEPITIDSGVKFKSYNSDITRSFCIEKEDEFFKMLYNIVNTAQKLAIDKVKPGTKISDIDKTARDFIAKKGYAKNFGHATGHGIGIDVHELPSISSKTKGVLKPGMVFTIEPGIYIPGWGGIRIEDMVVVTQKGHMVIT
ncbi:MAG: aminopeptidase P family protein [Candidatus Omnitrophota bacterium]